MTTPKRGSILPALIFTCFCVTKLFRENREVTVDTLTSPFLFFMETTRLFEKLNSLWIDSGKTVSRRPLKLRLQRRQ